MSAPFSQNNKAIRLIEPPQTKQRHKRLAHTRDVNELPLVNSLLAPESYLLLSTAPPLALLWGINLPQSPTRPPVNTRNSTLSTAALIAPSQGRQRNKIADTLRSNPRQYKNRPSSGRLYICRYKSANSIPFYAASWQLFGLVWRLWRGRASR